MSKQKVNQESGMKNHETHEKFPVSQKVALYNPITKKFLVLKEIDGIVDGDKYEGPWDLAGGRVNEQENLLESFKRELTEEIGEVDLEIKDPVLVDVLKVRNDPNGPRRCRVYYLALYKGGDIKISSEHTEFKWENLENIITNEAYEPVREAIEKAAEFLEREEYLNDLKRLQADFENYKKRQTEAQKELGGYLIEKLLLDIIPVLDNFRSATTHVPLEQKESPWVVGIQYIKKQLEDVVKSNGVEVIEPKEGEAFDPNIHEAVDSQQKAENGEPLTNNEKQATEEVQPHTIAKVLQNGFRIGGKVIRPAKVVVS